MGECTHTRRQNIDKQNKFINMASNLSVVEVEVSTLKAVSDWVKEWIEKELRSICRTNIRELHGFKIP